jgi:hypothetical protein
VIELLLKTYQKKTSQFIAPDLPIKQPQPYKEGTKVRDKKTKKIYIVRNGQLVPAE